MTSDSIEVSLPRDEKECAAAQQCMSIAFRTPIDRAKIYFDQIGRDNHQLVRVGNEVAGGLAILPMGQFFGGRSVPMAGVAAVNVMPQHRARGAGSALMRETMKHLHAQRFALSALHPATQPIYRRVGYEQAGWYGDARLPLRSMELGSRNGELDVHAIGEEHRDAVVELYRRRAAMNNGNLDRGEFLWNRVRTPRGEPAAGYIFARGAEPEGYLYLHQKEGGAAQHGYILQMSDFVTLTPDAGRTMLRFLANHRSMAEEATWQSPPADPVLSLLQEQRAHISLRHHWMLRIINVSAALEARGYPRGFQGELHLDLRDDVLPSNTGKFVVEINGKGAAVRTGGRGSLKMDVRGLAMMYSAFLSPLQMLATGLLEASEDDAAAAAGAFSGPTPWLVDMF